jgi:hypothetical protein
VAVKKVAAEGDMGGALRVKLVLPLGDQALLSTLMTAKPVIQVEDERNSKISRK